MFKTEKPWDWEMEICAECGKKHRAIDVCTCKKNCQNCINEDLCYIWEMCVEIDIYDNAEPKGIRKVWLNDYVCKFFKNKYKV